MLYFQTQSSPDRLGGYLRDFDESLLVTDVASDVPDTRLFSVKGTVPAAQGKESGYSDISLGIPRDFTRWFCLTRIWSPWLAPRHGQGNFFPKEDAVLASFLRWDGRHLVLLAVSGVENILSIFKPGDDGKVIIHSRNDSLENGQVHIVAAVGDTFESANAAALYFTRKVVTGNDYMSQVDKDGMSKMLEKDVKPEWMENWYDGLTYCTWNALGQDLTEKKVFDALDILKNNDISITNLIIDDNWQSLDNHGESQFLRGWTDFDANKEGFPRGLQKTVTDIRDNHPNIQHIAVWHAILGYWGGVSPTGNIAKNYKTRRVRKAKGLVEGTMTVVDADDAPRMYDDFYRFLLEAGVDSVKTDAQFFLDLIDDADDRRRFITLYQDAWTVASLRYFSVKAISCMSQTPQILFHTQLPSNKPRLMVRNSDDFFPEIEASHPWHIFCNAHNSLLTQHLNVLPDWDMFQTSHEYSAFHAAGRCISGGPIYITDEPGKHDLDLIKQMTARSIQGKTIILRPDTIGRSVGIYTAYEEERLLRVGTYHGNKENGTGILAIFNVSQRPISEFIHLKDFPGCVGEPHKKYVIRAHTTSQISSPMSLSDTSPLVHLALETKGYEILTAHPVHTFSLGSEESSPTSISTTPLGLLGKMTAAAALTSVSLSLTQPPGDHAPSRLHMQISLKALGTLGIYIQDLASRKIDDMMVMIRGQALPVECVSKAKEEETVLSIDVERAWKEMMFKPGWGNEIVVDVFV